MCRNLHLFILLIFRIWHVQMPKSLDFKDFKDLARADVKIFKFLNLNHLNNGLSEMYQPFVGFDAKKRDRNKANINVGVTTRPTMYIAFSALVLILSEA